MFDGGFIMGMYRETGSMFSGVDYNHFTTAELRAAMQRKLHAVTVKIAERERRVRAIVAEYRIAPEAMTDLVMRFMRDAQERRTVATYTTSRPSGGDGSEGAPSELVVPAGVVANIVAEKNLQEGETKEVAKLRLVLANLRDRVPYWDDQRNAAVRAESPPVEPALSYRAVVHKLNDDEMEYLGMAVVEREA